MAEPEIASRAEVLALLTEKAREGSTSAMIALERALRAAGEKDELDRELRRLLDKWRGLRSRAPRESPHGATPELPALHGMQNSSQGCGNSAQDEERLGIREILAGDGPGGHRDCAPLHRRLQPW